MWLMGYLMLINEKASCEIFPEKSRNLIDALMYRFIFQVQFKFLFAINEAQIAGKNMIDFLFRNFQWC